MIECNFFYIIDFFKIRAITYFLLQPAAVLMSIEISTGFAPVTHNIAFDPAKIEKGKKFAEKNIKNIKEFSGFGSDRLIQSLVRKTTKPKETYEVKLEVNMAYKKFVK